ncbi:MAG: transketolase [Firmicutes bacterium]|nr:transketolase [Bacillota bacterium]
MGNSGSKFQDVLTFLQVQSNKSRLMSLEMTYKAKQGHIAPDFSCLDILTVLYFSTLRIDPANPKLSTRDRFVLSKGHAAGALYATLAAREFIPKDWLDTYQGYETRLMGHPDRLKTPGVEHNTGALGHGLSVASGMAAALRQQDHGDIVPNVYVLIGDGELQEGSNWEAIMLASHMQLANLTAIIDRNGLQQGDFVDSTLALGDLSAKFRSFAWDVSEVDGHDHGALMEAFTPRNCTHGAPRAIIANTTKGRGVSFIENQSKWHHKVPSESEYELARAELLVKIERGSSSE